MIWRHIKTGNLYEVLCIARDCTNGDRDGKEAVVYRRQGDTSQQFVRERGEFEQKFEAVTQGDHVLTALYRDATRFRENADLLAAENDRLSAWLRRIDGGDAPCTDEAQLRQWAYDAVTLGKPAP